jgi:hypothetical protein
MALLLQQIDALQAQIEALMRLMQEKARDRESPTQNPLTNTGPSSPQAVTTTDNAGADTPEREKSRKVTLLW